MTLRLVRSQWIHEWVTVPVLCLIPQLTIGLL